ncbi:MAG: efflux RND transporter periplasmic adaptor subunit [Candidatus Tectomicrobia bacterium]|uniref:Efflux RND transporter periplasmic adaptor subunit n=1 Tax=Tectimicrobiota bacterium TaxID=2528274 RepID=A0A932CMZ5_UNCTE|nr:efflux RND transporter periplasmic adaptor subunit [Candidatus Tectomicrobia bacterium]
MPEKEEVTDLSRLRISRQEERAPAGKKGRAYLWLAGLLAFLIWIGALGFFLRDRLWGAVGAFLSTPEVTVFQVPQQASPGPARLLSANGYIVARKTSILSSRTSGRVVWLGCEVGDRVKAGEVVARLESNEQQARLESAQAALHEAEARLREARANLLEDQRREARSRQLLDEKVLSQAEYDLSRATLEAAQARVASLEAAVKTAEANLHFAEVQLDHTQIRAPFNGVITGKHAEVGEMVTAGSYSGQITGGAVFRLADFGSLEMEADVTEANLGKVRVGQPAEIVTDAYPDRIYRGRLRQIVPTADRQKAVVQVRVEILDKDGRLLPEMSAQVSFFAGETRSTAADAGRRSSGKILVPAEALRIIDQETAVYLVEDQRAKVRKIRRGGKVGRMVEVLEGLSGGEQVILSGPAGLREGDQVTIAASR